MDGKYSMLPQHASIADDQEFTRPPTTSILARPARLPTIILLLGFALLASLGANAVLAYRQFVRPWELETELPTRYARLRRNVPTEIYPEADYNSLNRTIQEAAWTQPDLEPWNFFIALDEDYTKAQDLPHSQRWPWDEDKGVYIPTSAHELHCVRVLRVFANENEDEVPKANQTWAYPHVLHCLNLLRESVMCNADDTPLYVGRLHKNAALQHPRAGTGMVKMCRNWQALADWTRERSACYRPLEVPELERYKYCPDGARPWEDSNP